MGTFLQPITLTGPEGASETLETMVDTGASFTSVPASVLERLGVQRGRRARLRLADGRVGEWALGWVVARIDSIEEQTVCLFGPEEAPPVIGSHTLQQMLLRVEPVEHHLVPTEGFL